MEDTLVLRKPPLVSLRNKNCTHLVRAEIFPIKFGGCNVQENNCHTETSEFLLKPLLLDVSSRISLILEVSFGD